MDIVDFVRFFLSFAVVIGLIAGLAWVLRRYGAGRIAGAAGGKGRLSVVEATAIDAKRRLVLVRRDTVEHLILLSPTTETVVETGIAPGPGNGRFSDQLETAQAAADSPQTGGPVT